MKLSKIASLLNPINLIQRINDLIDVARSPLKRSTAYVVGDIVHVYALPSNLYLECTQAGTTSTYNLTLSTTPNTTLTDGTVKWIVRDKNDVIRKSGAASKGDSTTPIYFDANGVAQTITSYSGNSASATKLGSTTVGSATQAMYLNSGTPTAITNSTFASTLMNALGVGSSTPVDDDYFISQYVNGGTTTTTYHRRPFSALWTYIKGKADSVYQPINTCLVAKTANGYVGMASNSGTDNVWIRTTTQGLLPYQSGGLGSGHCKLGTSSWCFSDAYVDNIYCKALTENGTLLEDKYQPKGNYLTSHQDISGKLNKSGDTMTGVLYNKNTNITRGTAPSANQTRWLLLGRVNSDKAVGGLYHWYNTDKTGGIRLYAYNNASTTDTNAYIGIQNDANGNLFTYAPTPTTTDNSTKIATTAFVKAQNYLTTHQDISGKANLASPAFTGTPTAPTAATATNNTQIATTAYVKNNLANYVPTTRTVNGKALSANITLDASDVGAATVNGHSWVTTKATTTSSASSTKPAVVVTNYVSGNDWYRVWSDGWIEQGGCNTAGYGTNRTQTTTFKKAFTTTNYNLVVCNQKGTSHYPDQYIYIDTKTTTNFSTWVDDWGYISWYACGY